MNSWSGDALEAVMNGARKASAAGGFAAELDALRKELEGLGTAMETATESRRGEWGEKTRGFVAQAKAFIDKVGTDARDAADRSVGAARERAQAAVKEGTAQVEEVIRDRPLTAVAVAFGIGCVLTWLARRR